MAVSALMCLSLTVYFEARNQDIEGQVAVAQVVLNRVEDERYPDNICDVVVQGGERRKYRCQFSWYCDGKSDVPYDQETWEKSMIVASWVLHDGVRLPELEGAVYYHADYVDPYWNEHMQQVAYIGDHIFYRDAVWRN